MPLEKSIIKAQAAQAATFEYKPRELATEVSEVARSFVDVDAFRSTDFKISGLIAEQAGIAKLESDAHQDKINAQVLARLKEVEEKAYKEGYELGLIEGTEKAFQEAKGDLIARLKSMESLLKRMEELKNDLLIANEADLVKLVFLTARKIAVRDLEEHRDAAWEILKNVITETQSDERVIVRLHPADLLFIQTLQDKGGEHIESLQRVKFVTDEAIKPGGCLIETEYGTVDATIEERVERTWATLQSRMPHKKSDTEGG